MLRHVLKKLMGQKKINAAHLSEVTGISQPTLHRLLTGSSPDPRLSSIIPLAKFFNLTIGQLLGDEPLFSDGLQEKISFSKVPIISWEEAAKWNKLISTLTVSTWAKWIISNLDLSKNSYAIKSDSEFVSPHLSKCSFLIIDPVKTPQNKNYIVVKLSENSRVSLKQLYIDGDDKWLIDPNKKLREILFDSSHIFCGTVVQIHLNID
jgi:SOS-response transcriptional repressor LexA